MKRTKLYKKALQISNEYSERVDIAEMCGDEEYRTKALAQWGALNSAFAELFDVKITQIIHDAVWLEKEN